MSKLTPEQLALINNTCAACQKLLFEGDIPTIEEKRRRAFNGESILGIRGRGCGIYGRTTSTQSCDSGNFDLRGELKP